MFLLRLFGSKKLIAIVASIIAQLLVPVLNAKLGLNLDPVEMAASIGSIAAVTLAFIAAQWHIDIKTEGATSTVKMLEHIASPVAPGPMPAKVATAMQVALMFLPEGAAKDAVKAALDEYSE